MPCRVLIQSPMCGCAINALRAKEHQVRGTERDRLCTFVIAAGAAAFGASHFCAILWIFPRTATRQ